ncbi:MAG: MFS transporter [Candidatus Aminicenantes bacterium]|nr:MFS transporter [Candidatus Aminicenantes bacterium]
MRKKKLAPGILSIQLLVLMSYSSIAMLILLSLYFKHLGGSPRQIGFLLGIFSLSAFLSRPFVGWLLSRYNPRKVVVAGLILVLIMTTMYLFIRELNWFVVFIRVFHGVGFSVFILAALLIAVLITREEERAYAIGVVSTGFMLPLLIVPFMGEGIIERFGFFFFFLCAIFLAAIPLLYSLFWRVKLPRFPEDSEVKSVSFLRLLRQKRICLIFFLTLIFEIGLSSSLSFVPLLAHGESLMWAGYYYTFLSLTAVFMRLYGGKRFIFWGNPKLLLPAFYFISGGGILIYFASNNILLGLSGIIWGIGVGILYPHLTALVVQGVASREQGKVLSLFASSVDLGFALGPLLFGWISQYSGLRETFIIFALFIFLSSSVLILWGKSSLFKKD